MKNTLNHHDKCTGCAVCVLSCPVWAQTHDLMLTAAGRARALQAGAEPEELRESAEACLLCGSCSPVCPSGVDTVALTTSLRARLGRGAGKPVKASGFTAAGKKVFLPGPALRSAPSLFARASRALEAAGYAVPPADELSELAADLDAGLEPDGESLRTALGALRGAAGFAAAEGSLLRRLRQWFPSVPAAGLGEVLLLAGAKKALGAGDLYVPDPRAFNADQKRLVKFYDSVRQETGCAMSTSLQRAAMPAGPSHGHRSRLPAVLDAAAQAAWVLGRAKAKRVVLESADDLELFRKGTKAEVLHVAELA